MLVKGIFTDVEINNQPPGFARHLKNILLTEKLGTPINEPGFSVYVGGNQLPYTVMGIRVIDEAIVLWSTDNTNSEIGIVENGAYRTLVNDGSFNDTPSYVFTGIEVIGTPESDSAGLVFDFSDGAGPLNAYPVGSEIYVTFTTPSYADAWYVVSSATYVGGSYSRIGLVGFKHRGATAGEVTDIRSGINALNFNTSAPIDAEYYMNFNSERVVAWISDINEPRILNIDNIDIQELNDIKMFPYSDAPVSTYTVQNSGGGLEAGTHQIVLSYVNRSGLETNWLTPGIPLNITDDPTTATESNYDGVIAGFITAKAILIELTEVDDRFDFIRIGVVKTINGIVTAQTIKSVPITGETLSVLYAGTEGTIQDITLDEILVPSASYTSAKAIGQVNNKLFLGNLTVDEDIDLTDVALDIDLEWVASLQEGVITSLGDNVGNNKNPINDTTFLPGEVYAFYLTGEKIDGSLTKSFHIPGREVDTPLDLATSAEAVTAKFSDIPYQYEVESTVKDIVGTEPISFGAAGTVNTIFTGKFGFWKNQNEDYPLSSSKDVTVTAAATYVGGYPLDSSIGVPTGEDFYTVRVAEDAMTFLGDPTLSARESAKFYKRFTITNGTTSIPANITQVIDGPLGTVEYTSGTAIPATGTAILQVVRNSVTDNIMPGSEVVLTGFGAMGSGTFRVISRTPLSGNYQFEFDREWRGINTGTVESYGAGGYFDCVLDKEAAPPTGWGTYILPSNTSGINTGFTGDLVTTGFTSNLAEGLEMTVPSGTLESELPQTGEVVNLTSFSQNNGSYLVTSSVLVNATTASVFIDTSIPDIRQHPNGTGFVTYTYQDVSGQNWPTGEVRHHRFPTLGGIHAMVKADNTNMASIIGKTIFPILRVKASNVNLSPDQQTKITRWFITYAKRTPANATVMGQAPYQYAGLEEQVYNAGVVGGIGKEFSSNIGNFCVGNTENSTNNGERTGLNYSRRYVHQEVLKFNCFDLIVGQPSMGSLYIRNEVKYYDPNAYDTKDETDVPSQDSGTYRNPGALHGVKLSRWTFTNILKDSTVSTTPENSVLREISQYTYLPANIVTGGALGVGADLRMGEDNLYLKVRGGHPVSSGVSSFNIFDPTGEDAGIPPVDIAINYQIFGYNSGTDTDHSNSTFLSTLCQRKDNVYVPFTEQPIVICNNKASSTDTTGIFAGGDGRINTISLRQLAPYAAENPGEENGEPDKFKQVYTSPTAFGAGTMGIHYHGAYSTKNPGLKYTSDTDEGSLYFPKSADFMLGVFDLVRGGNYRIINYSEDYSLNNSYNAITVHNPISIPASTTLPHTIVSSVTQRVEERTISWQTFLAADRYVMPRDKGPIVNIQGVGTDRLYIHQRDSLFITRSTTRLKGDIVDVTLGSGDIFDVAPSEVLSTDEGFGGTQHKFACKLTKIGYAFPDVAQGKIFLHNGKSLDEISRKGQRIFWRDNVNTELIDNPFMGAGVSLTYDEKYNRLLVSVRNGVRSFTSSYSAATEAWLSYHDYFPEYFIQTRKQLYSLKNEEITPGYGGLFKHNDTLNGSFGIYYNVVEAEPVPFPVLIDIVYNPNPYDQKNYSAVEWASEVIQADGVQAKDETIDYITISNNQKTTGRVELERLINLSQIHSHNTRNVNEFWRFNGLRDISRIGVPFRLDFYNDFAIPDSTDTISLDANKSWYRKAKFIDRFIIARYEYSNLSNNSFAFLNHDVNLRKSYR